MNKKLVLAGAALTAFVMYAAFAPKVVHRTDYGGSTAAKSLAPLIQDYDEAAAPQARASGTVSVTPGASGALGGGMGVAGEPQQGARLTLASMSDSQTDRYLIKNAVIQIEAPDVIRAAAQAKEYARSVSGYVSSSHESVDSLGLKNVALEVRVPAQRFDSAMQNVAGLGRVMDSQVTSEDVTEQFVDTDAQLRNLKATEARLLDHLRLTGKLTDTLAVEKELSRVREGADELEGKLRFMSHRIGYSTISMTFKEPAHVEPIAPPELFSPLSIATQAMRSVTGCIQMLITAGVWVLVWSVLWAPLALAGRYLYLKQARTGRLF